ncbi:hypothetical protein [uncultured Methylibium sp.]|uniref:hypothetical protein n=1 Tax=uncultured Methylibium sp. TaxID=381093 RepID=UPI0025DF662E|nr:hypothetical protein [uncultured Methylibium sp.]
MFPRLLLVVAAAVTAVAQAAPSCPAPRQVVERFVPADCEACWAEPGAALPGSTWVLDWIAPSPRGAEAALAVAALAEAAERLDALEAAPAAVSTQVFRWTVRARPGPALRVAGGPAWNGYLGLELTARGKPPAGAVAYLALVEDVPAGSEGTAVARRLVRAVAGPLPLDAGGRVSTQLRALRIPEGARAERLRGAAWWVDGRQQLGGLALEGCPGRPAP